MWYYQDANADLIKEAVNRVDWDTLLALNDVDSQVSKFSDVILNIMSNYIPHEKIVCDDKDPPWVNKRVKVLLNENRQIYNSYKASKNNFVLQQMFKASQETLRREIENSKLKYFQNLSDKLSSESPNSKSYWTLLKSFLSNTKIPCIPPLFHLNRYIVDFKEKCDLFNCFFSDQCSLIDTNSIIPSDSLKLTDNVLSNIEINVEEILNIIRTLNLNKVHGPDGISIRMIKIC